jgi:hypothetical protein
VPVTPPTLQDAKALLPQSSSSILGVDPGLGTPYSSPTSWDSLLSSALAPNREKKPGMELRITVSQKFGKRSPGLAR